MATAAQIAANRANAERSTGPKTPEGKARSRANSFKHGMTGSGIVLPPEEQARWEHRSETWAIELGARGELDGFLAGRAAMASIRLDRCVRNETAALAPSRANMLGRWQRARVERSNVAAIAKVFATDPAHAVRHLSRTVLGCEFLIDAWGKLAAVLESDCWWTFEESRQVLALLGTAALPTRLSEPRLAAFWLATLGTRAETDEPPAAGELVRFFGADDSASHALPDFDPAIDALTALCASELERLGALREGHWEAVDGPDRQEALDKVMIDTSKDGMLRRRYETASTSELHRAIDQIHRNHRAADREACETVHEMTPAVSPPEDASGLDPDLDLRPMAQTPSPTTGHDVGAMASEPGAAATQGLGTGQGHTEETPLDLEINPAPPLPLEPNSTAPPMTVVVVGSIVPTMIPDAALAVVEAPKVESTSVRPVMMPLDIPPEAVDIYHRFEQTAPPVPGGGPPQLVRSPNLI